MNHLYLSYLYPFLAMTEVVNSNSKRKLKELRKEYANLQNLPRKKKKREKKRILLEYSIFSYDPFTGKHIEED